MQYTIQNKILSLLAASSTLYAGGTAYATEWQGVKTVYSGQSAVDDYVNLHKSREKADGSRPAIYLGSRSLKLTDTNQTTAINSVGMQYRRMRIPLVIVCRATNTTRPTTTAESMVEQLAQNVYSILMQNRVATEWTLLTIEAISETESGTGGASSDVVEARCVLDVVVEYRRSPNTSP